MNKISNFYKIKIWLAIKNKWLRPHLLTENERSRLAMLEFRSLALLIGLDVSKMSDEEIIEGVIKTAKALSEAGLSASEAGQALRRMALVGK